MNCTLTPQHENNTTDLEVNALSKHVPFIHRDKPNEIRHLCGMLNVCLELQLQRQSS